MRYLFALALLAACKGGAGTDATDDTDVVEAGLSGMWEVSKEWINQGSCQGKGEESSVPVPFIKLFKNGSTLEVTFCSGADTCPPTPDWYMEADGSTWLQETHSGEISETYGCMQFYTERTAEIIDGELTLDERDWQLYDSSITGARECDNAIPEFFGSGGECTDRHLFTAAKP